MSRGFRICVAELWAAEVDRSRQTPGSITINSKVIRSSLIGNTAYFLLHDLF